MEEKILETLNIKSKVIGCNCTGWKKSWHQIEASQVRAHMDGNTYTGNVFIFCPWCGEKTKLVVG